MVPKISMTLLVRNEASIISENIRFHNAVGVDSFIVMDNLSCDNTRKTIKSLSSEIPIDYLFQAEDDYSQSEWVTYMARKAAIDHRADWVINNDADEFWLPTGNSLKSLLTNVDERIPSLSCTRHNAVVMSKSGLALEGSSHPRTSFVFEHQSCNSNGFPLPDKIIHRASEDIVVRQGNHSVTGLSGKQQKAGKQLRILHFPYQYLKHYESKVTLGGAAYERNKRVPLSLGGTWRRHRALLQEDEDALNKFWAGLVCNEEQVLAGLNSGELFLENRVLEILAGLRFETERCESPKGAARRSRRRE